jgi:hypothetical protein
MRHARIIAMKKDDARFWLPSEALGVGGFGGVGTNLVQNGGY